MKKVQSNILTLATLIAFMILLVSCNSGSNEEDECQIDHDCDLPLVCVEGKCVEDSGNDGDRECESNFDCSGRQVCNKETGQCVDSIDGDDETDEEAEISENTENEEDGDVDGDSEIEDTETTETAEEEEEIPVQVEFISPVDGKAVDGSVKIQLAITSELEIDKVEVTPYGSSITTLTSQPWELNWDTSSLEEKESVEIRAVVYAGDYIVPHKIYVAIDHTDPTVEIISPTENEIFGHGDQVIIQVDAKDNIGKIEIYIDGSVYQSDQSPSPEGNGYFTYKYNISEFAKGSHPVMVKVEDSTGKHSQVNDESSFIIDNKAPEMVIENVIWDDQDPNSGILYAEYPLSINFADDSGVKSASAIIKKGNSVLLNLTEASLFPYKKDNINDLLILEDEMYPVVLTITGEAVDNMDNSSSTIEKQITVKRIKWEFDPRSVNSEFSVPESYIQPTGAAQSQKTQNIYVTLYNELHAISNTGASQWSCIADNYFTSTPVVSETASSPPVVMASTINGTTYFKIDNETNPNCITNRPETNLISPSPPVVISQESILNGFVLTYLTCASKLGNTICYKMTLTHTETATTSTNVFSETPLWTETIEGVAYPTSMVMPYITDNSNTYRSMTFGASDQLMQIRVDDGMVNPTITTPDGGNLKNVVFIPSLPGIAGLTNKTARLYSNSLTNFNSKVDAEENPTDCPAISEHFLDQQPVSTSSGTIFLASEKCLNYTSTSVLEAWELNYSKFSYVFWTFYPQGLSGGTPVIGEDDILYLATSNSNGNLYAIDIYNENQITGGIVTDGHLVGGEMEPIWQMRLNTAINAPLLITYEGNLVVVGEDNKVRMLDIHGSYPLSAEDSWPMYQSSPSRQGLSYPN